LQSAPHTLHQIHLPDLFLIRTPAFTSRFRFSAAKSFFHCPLTQHYGSPPPRRTFIVDMIRSHRSGRKNPEFFRFLAILADRRVFFFSPRASLAGRLWRGNRTLALQTEYDGIIIGAGHNGLILAGDMARAGLDVVVLERYLEQGGGLDTHVDPRRWREIQDELLDALHGRWAEYAPNLGKPGVIVNRFCQTPLDIEAHVATMVRGDQLEGRLSDGQFYDRRPGL
jgi:hypothetical protein